MLALFVLIAVLILAHGMAVGAYLAKYKLGLETTVGKTMGTIAFGAAYSIVVAFIAAILILPPIA